MIYRTHDLFIDAEVIGSERAEYSRQIVATLGRQLTDRFGRGFSAANLHRMLKFSQLFPDEEIVVTLSPQLSWSHILALLPVKTEEDRAFYIDQAITGKLSVRALRDLIGRQGYERKEIANAQTSASSVIPTDSFRDPYFLDFLGLQDTWQEKDLEDAIIRELGSFLLEVGNGWTFVAASERVARRELD